MTGDAAGLATLEQRLAEDLERLDYPPKPWVVPTELDGRRIADVTVIGAGMCGLAVAFALRRQGIDTICVVDAAPEGSEGPWVTYARMRTLRSPKQLTGPAMGMASLTFRAWYEAQFGKAAWGELDKIPTPMWMDYLGWYRRVLGIAVESATRVTAVVPRPDGRIDLHLAGSAGERVVTTRKLVLATGRDGLGGSWLPEVIEALPSHLRAHSADAIDFAALRGKRVGVIGAGASAMDNAGAALEAGAAALDMFIRRRDIPRVNKLTGIGSQGVVNGFRDLPDPWKWRFLHYAMSEQTPPPRSSVLRVTRHASARLHLASPIRSASVEGDAILLETPRGRYRLDFLIAATGFAVDFARRPELAEIAPHITLWADRYTPAEDEADAELASYPYLGPAFEFIERTPGRCPALAHIHCFNFPATLSHGKLSGDIPAISDGAERLARGIAARLFVEDREAQFAALEAFDTPELFGDEWTDADAAA